MLSRSFAVTAAAALMAIAGVAATADSADAQSRSRSRSVTVAGPNGVATRNTDIYRSPGSTSVNRSGTVNGQSWSSSRNRSTVQTDGGYATTTTRVGPAGNTQTSSREVACDENSCTRSAGAQTSGGYGYQREGTVTVDEEGVTVTRSGSTNNGASRSSTVTRPY